MPELFIKTVQAMFFSRNKSGAEVFTAECIDLYNVDQTTPLGTYVGATGNDLAPTVTVVSQSGNLVVDAMAHWSNTGAATIGAGQSQISTTQNASSWRGDASREPGAASTVMSWSYSSTGDNRWALGAIEVKRAGRSTAHALENTLQIVRGGIKTINPLTTGAPRTVTTSSDVVLLTDDAIIANYAGTVTETLLDAATYPGRWLTIKTVTANAVISAASNVVPLAGGAAGTAVLAATAGKWAEMQSDGSSWVIMRAG